MGHTGGAVGFTSILFMSLPSIMTSNRDVTDAPCSAPHLPPICVAILVNLEGAREVGKLAIQIAEVFTAALLGDESPILVALPEIAA